MIEKFGPNTITSVVNSLMKPLIYRLFSTSTQIQVNKIRKRINIYELKEVTEFTI